MSAAGLKMRSTRQGKTEDSRRIIQIILLTSVCGKLQLDPTHRYYFTLRTAIQQLQARGQKVYCLELCMGAQARCDALEAQ